MALLDGARIHAALEQARRDKRSRFAFVSRLFPDTWDICGTQYHVPSTSSSSSSSLDDYLASMPASSAPSSSSSSAALPPPPPPSVPKRVAKAIAALFADVDTAERREMRALFTQAMRDEYGCEVYFDMKDVCTVRIDE